MPNPENRESKSTSEVLVEEFESRLLEIYQASTDAALNDVTEESNKSDEAIERYIAQVEKCHAAFQSRLKSTFCLGWDSVYRGQARDVIAPENQELFEFQQRRLLTVKTTCISMMRGTVRSVL